MHPDSLVLNPEVSNQVWVPLPVLASRAQMLPLFLQSAPEVPTNKLPFG